MVPVDLCARWTEEMWTAAASPLTTSNTLLVHFSLFGYHLGRRRHALCCMFVCVFVCVFVCLYICIHICVYMYIYIYTYICIYIYTHIHTHVRTRTHMNSDEHWQASLAYYNTPDRKLEPLSKRISPYFFPPASTSPSEVS